MSVEVSYLIHHQEPIERFHRFALHLKEFSPGIDHSLKILCKGKSSRWNEIDRSFEVIEVEDVGFDLTSYLKFARSSSADILCLLNSHSRPLADNWLKMLTEPLSDRSVGAVSSTASWESWRTSFFQNCAFYGLMSGLKTFSQFFQGRAFLPFPNPHLRTNGLAIRRTSLLQFQDRPLQTKSDCYRFESGKEGLSQSLFNAKEKLLLVNRHGQYFEPHEWAKARVFRNQFQEDLLIADNQTDFYLNAPERMRKHLSKITWKAI